MSWADERSGLDEVKVVLCDADGNLFASEEPAFVASCEVTNRMMESLGLARRFEPEELRLATTGRNFRHTAAELVAREGGELTSAQLEEWVDEERRQVTAHLRVSLAPDEVVSAVLDRLSQHFELALVSSSAAARIDACLESTDLAGFFPADRRFSAEDSLPRPVSKPDPKIYSHSLERLGVSPGEAVAIEDSGSGVASAVGAGIATVGNVCFVPGSEREDRVQELRTEGAFHVVGDWPDLLAMSSPAARERVAEGTVS